MFSLFCRLLPNFNENYSTLEEEKKKEQSENSTVAKTIDEDFYGNLNDMQDMIPLHDTADMDSSSVSNSTTAPEDSDASFNSNTTTTTPGVPADGNGTIAYNATVRQLDIA